MSKRSGRTRTTVRDFDEALDAVNGRSCKHNGIAGTIRVDRSTPHHLRVWHEPSAAGKRSEAYQKTKRQLHDDWTTDLTWSESLPTIMQKMGIAFEGGR